MAAKLANAKMISVIPAAWVCHLVSFASILDLPQSIVVDLFEFSAKASGAVYSLRLPSQGYRHKKYGL